MEDQVFEQLLDTFNTEGWKLIVGDFQQLANQALDVQSIEDGTGLHFRKGQLDVLARVLNYENLVRQQQELNEEEDK